MVFCGKPDTDLIPNTDLKVKVERGKLSFWEGVIDL